MGRLCSLCGPDMAVTVQLVPGFTISGAAGELVRGLPGRSRAAAGRRRGYRAAQARTQAPPERVRPTLTRVRRFSPAHRLCSQALFLMVPMYLSLTRRPFWVAVQAMVRSILDRVGYACLNCGVLARARASRSRPSCGWTVIDRPSLAVVHCARSGQPAHAAPKVTDRV